MDLKKSVDLCPTMPMSWATWGIALFKLGTTDEQVLLPKTMRSVSRLFFSQGSPSCHPAAIILHEAPGDGKTLQHGEHLPTNAPHGNVDLLC